MWGNPQCMAFEWASLVAQVVKNLPANNKGLSSQGYGFFQWSYMDARVGL